MRRYPRPWTPTPTCCRTCKTRRWPPWRALCSRTSQHPCENHMSEARSPRLSPTLGNAQTLAHDLCGRVHLPADVRAYGQGPLQVRSGPPAASRELEADRQLQEASRGVEVPLAEDILADCPRARSRYASPPRPKPQSASDRAARSTATAASASVPRRLSRQQASALPRRRWASAAAPCASRQRPAPAAARPSSGALRRRCAPSRPARSPASRRPSHAVAPAAPRERPVFVRPFRDDGTVVCERPGHRRGQVLVDMPR